MTLSTSKKAKIGHQQRWGSSPGWEISWILHKLFFCFLFF